MKMNVEAEHIFLWMVSLEVNKLMSVFHASVLLLIMNRHNIVKIAVEPRGDSEEPMETWSKYT